MMKKEEVVYKQVNSFTHKTVACTVYAQADDVESPRQGKCTYFVQANKTNAVLSYGCKTASEAIVLAKEQIDKSA